jgi:hypothetical protein
MTKKEFSMATVRQLVTTCDRHGGEIADGKQFLHLSVTAGGKARGRKARQSLDLCEACAKAFAKFMEGEQRG